MSLFSAINALRCSLRFACNIVLSLNSGGKKYMGSNLAYRFSTNWRA